MKQLKFLLFPLTILYGCIIRARNVLFTIGFLKSQSFSIPLISVGNLSVGGTGKSVVVDYLLLRFASQYRLATLSRGYGRKTKGFRIGGITDTAQTLGDEPYQFFQKYPKVTVAVCEKRAIGIQSLMDTEKGPDAIILDDAFQHRWVKPQLQILTTTFQRPFIHDYLLPMGRLREPRKGKKRADIVLLTKTPTNTTSADRSRALAALQLQPHQKGYCCSIGYANTLMGQESIPWEAFKKAPFLLVTGIADATPLVAYLNSENTQFDHLEYTDHFDFDPSSIRAIVAKAGRRPILTTEKDFGRLSGKLPPTHKIYYLPIQLQFFDTEAATSFEQQIENALKMS